MIGVLDADGNFETIPTTLADILHDYKVKDPVRLYVELSEKGIIRCKGNPYLETNVQCKENGVGGYIDTVIDRPDLEFTSQFFMSLGEDAKVVEPKKMIEYILSFAKKTLAHYQ